MTTLPVDTVSGMSETNSRNHLKVSLATGLESKSLDLETTGLESKSLDLETTGLESKSLDLET